VVPGLDEVFQLVEAQQQGGSGGGDPRQGAQGREHPGLRKRLVDSDALGLEFIEILAAEPGQEGVAPERIQEGRSQELLQVAAVQAGPPCQQGCEALFQHLVPSRFIEFPKQFQACLGLIGIPVQALGEDGPRQRIDLRHVARELGQLAQDLAQDIPWGHVAAAEGLDVDQHRPGGQPPTETGEQVGLADAGGAEQPQGAGARRLFILGPGQGAEVGHRLEDGFRGLGVERLVVPGGAPGIREQGEGQGGGHGRASRSRAQE